MATVAIWPGTPAAIQQDDIGLRQLALTLPAPDTVGPESRVPLRVGVRPRGILLLNGASLSTQTLLAIGGLVSISIDRAQALEEVTRGEASKESERLRSLMIDSITHELRTPLTAIKASASTLLLPGGLSEEQRHDLLEVIDEESDRLNRLVSEAVEMAQLDAQEVHMAFTADAGSDAGGARGGGLGGTCLPTHELKLNLPTLPPVLADMCFLEKVLVNLLENAGKYSAKGSPIFVSAERRGDEVAISVADRGVGIDIAEQSLIFERFYRAAGTQPADLRYGNGTGYQPRHHRGAPWNAGSDQPDGEGSVFTLTLPIARQAE